MNNQKNALIGIILIIISTIAIIQAQDIYQDAYETSWYRSTSLGEEKRKKADILFYSACSVNGIGFSLLLANLLKKEEKD